MDKTKNLVDLLLSADLNKFEAPKEQVKVNSLSKIFNKDFKVTVKGITPRQYTLIQQKAVKTKNGALQEADLYLLQSETVLAGLVEPDLHNSELCKHFNVATPLELVGKLFNAGELFELSNVISKLSGFDKTENDQVEEIKN